MDEFRDIFNDFVLAQALPFNKLNNPAVYLILHLKTNRVYIGGTRNFRERMNRHLVELRANKHNNKRLQEDFNNDDFISFYVKETRSKESAHNDEQLLLNRYFGKDWLYNNSPDARSQRGYRHSQDTIRKMKIIRNSPRLVEFIRNLHKGKKLSPEHRAKSIATLERNREFEKLNPIPKEIRQKWNAHLKNVPRTNEVRKRMSEGRLAKSNPVVVDGKEYSSITLAVRETGIKYTTICERLKSCNFPTYHRIIKQS